MSFPFPFCSRAQAEAHSFLPVEQELFTSKRQQNKPMLPKEASKYSSNSSCRALRGWAPSDAGQNLDPKGSKASSGPDGDERVAPPPTGASAETETPPALHAAWSAEQSCGVAAAEEALYKIWTAEERLEVACMLPEEAGVHRSWHRGKRRGNVPKSLQANVQSLTLWLLFDRLMLFQFATRKTDNRSEPPTHALKCPARAPR